MLVPYQMQYAEITRRLIEYPFKIGDSRIGKINSRFCEQLRIDLAKEFPLQDIKKIKPSNIIHELLWMLKGDSNIRYLVKNGCHIWTDDAYRYYKEKYAKFHKANRPENKTKELFYHTKEEFVDLCLNHESIQIPVLGGGIKHYYFGDLDRIYGVQWRNYNGKTDQLKNEIEKLINNPDDRRMIITGHNPTDIQENNVGLPSCHNYMQFYTSFDEDGNRVLSTFCNIRSNDWFLGQPYNAAQYALLTHIIANIVGMKVGQLVINSVDAHLYHKHYDAADKWLARYGKIMEDNYEGEQGLDHDWYEILGCKAQVKFKREDFTIEDITADDIEIVNYNPQGFIKAPLLT